MRKISPAVAAFIAALAIIPLAAQADSVGTSIYSPGPLIPMQAFTLKMKMAHPTMQIIKKDVKKMQTITCHLVPAYTNDDMAILTCVPGK